MMKVRITIYSSESSNDLMEEKEADINGYY